MINKNLIGKIVKSNNGMDNKILGTLFDKYYIVKCLYNHTKPSYEIYTSEGRFFSYCTFLSNFIKSEWEEKLDRGIASTSVYLILE